MSEIILKMDNQEGLNALLERIAASSATYHTKEDVCRLFQISKGTLNKWIREGQIKFASIGGVVRISSKDLEAFYRRNRDMELLPKDLKKVGQ